jgi:hypothetical protein
MRHVLLRVASFLDRSRPKRFVIAGLDLAIHAAEGKETSVEETKASIANKPARGTFSATFFLVCVAALELDGVALDEI